MDKAWGQKANILIIYCKVIDKKSISDPKHLMCAFRIKLIQMNIKSRFCFGFHVLIGKHCY